MKYLILPLLFISLANAAEINQSLLKDLGNDDFDIREAATAKLSKLPIETLPDLIKLADKSDDPEVSLRLRKIAFQVFWENAYETHPKILQIRTTIDVEGCSLVLEIDPLKPELKVPSDPNSKTVFAYQAEFIETVDSSGPANEKLQVGDFIVKIDGQLLKNLEFENIEAGKEYEFTVIRPQKPARSLPNPIKIKEDECETKTIKITPRLSDCRDLPFVNTLITIAYKNYMKEFREKK